MKPEYEVRRWNVFSLCALIVVVWLLAWVGVKIFSDHASDGLRESERALHEGDI